MPTGYEIITAQEVKAALKIAEGEEYADSTVGDIVSAVSQGIEDFLGRPVIERDVTESVDGDGTRTLLLKPYLQSVTTVVVDDVTIASTDRVFYPKTGEVRLLYTSFAKGYQNVDLVYKHGWAIADVPYSIRRAALLWSLHHFRLSDKNRIGVNSVTSADQTISFVSDMPPDVKSLLEPYMLAGFGG